MKLELIILLIFSSSIIKGQTVINDIRLDTTGLLHWNFSAKGKDGLVVSIEKKVENKWISLSQRTIPRSVVVCCGSDGSSKELQLYKGTMNYIDSTFVPVDKGISFYRIQILNPTQPIISNEVFINRNTPHYLKLTSSGDYIKLDRYIVNCKIKDTEGKLIKTTGRTNMINISDLKKGMYYFDFSDNQIFLFEKNK